MLEELEEIRAGLESFIGAILTGKLVLGLAEAFEKVPAPGTQRQTPREWQKLWTSFSIFQRTKLKPFAVELSEIYEEATGEHLEPQLEYMGKEWIKVQRQFGWQEAWSKEGKEAIQEEVGTALAVALTKLLEDLSSEETDIKVIIDDIKTVDFVFNHLLNQG